MTLLCPGPGPTRSVLAALLLAVMTSAQAQLAGGIDDKAATAVQVMASPLTPNMVSTTSTPESADDAMPRQRMPMPSGTDPVWAPPSDNPSAEPSANAPEESGRQASGSQDGPRADLWQRVRLGFAMPELDGELVERWQRWYASRPDYVERMAGRGARYLFHIVEEVQRRGLPTELALLPFIESAFNPQALSGASASGIWQFMPATGRDFDLRQNLFRDDRRDVLASTRAALDYLETLHRMFGNWHLALAAYNWGQGNVLRAQERARRAGQSPDYTLLRMPDETRNYVPKLQAVKNIVLSPQNFGLTLPPLQNHPFFVAVEIDRDIDVALAARLAGMSLEDFQALNPQMNKPVVLAAGTPQLLLPYDNAEAFREALAKHGGPWASWTAWVAPRTLKVAEAAQMSGMAEAQLRAVNRIPPGMMVKAGSTLMVPRSARALIDVSERVADAAMIALVPEVQAMRKRTIRASARGETLAQLAKRHGVSSSQLASWNGLSATARLTPGQSLVLLGPAAERAKTQARAAQRPARPATARVKVAQAQQAARR